MRTTLLAPTLALLLPLATVTARAADWQPAKGPLMTRWAKDVTPDKAQPEYPRPQMVRKEWQSLNGLWEFAIGKKDEEAPLVKKLDGQILVPFPVESALSGVMKAADPNGGGVDGAEVTGFAGRLGDVYAPGPTNLVQIEQVFE